MSAQIGGPYEERPPLFCDEGESLYGGKIVDTPDGAMCLAFRNEGHSGAFVGGITDPMPIEIAPDGTINLVESHP